MRNTNMRSGFTMIELIFVIVIIGILSAVAIPKLAKTSIEAKKAKVTAFVGTLNRTVGATMWATKVSGDGKIVTLCSSFDTLKEYTDVPSEVTGVENDCRLKLATDMPTPATNAFQDGNTTEGPRWTFVW